MAQNAPGKHYRNGLTWPELFRLFPDNAAAEAWFVKTRWPSGIGCPKCGSLNVQERRTRKPQPYRCRDCRKDFSVKTGTLMQSSNLGLQVWAIAFYLLATGLKGTSSLKLHRDLGVTQKTAWHLAHRIRETWRDQPASFAGPVEADETFIGGKESNKHEADRLHEGRGAVGKTAVAGVKDRATRRVRASVVPDTTGETLRGFVGAHTHPDAMVYTDGEPAYASLPRHEAVKHSVGEYVRGQVHTNGMESFWSMLKRGYVGTYHQMSPEHMGRYVDEFAGRHNQREMDTIDQMQAMVRGLDGKRLRYDDLITHRHGGQAQAS